MVGGSEAKLVSTESKEKLGENIAMHEISSNPVHHKLLTDENFVKAPNSVENIFDYIFKFDASKADFLRCLTVTF